MNRRKTSVINQSLATSNTFTINICREAHWQPRYMIIRQVLYSNIAGADSGTYLIWCSLLSDYIGAFYVGIQGVSHAPETIISLESFQPTVDFRITPANAAFTGPTGQLTMTVEFCDCLEG